MLCASLEYDITNKEKASGIKSLRYNLDIVA
jgi:hypothetical protein